MREGAPVPTRNINYSSLLYLQSVESSGCHLATDGLLSAYMAISGDGRRKTPRHLVVADEQYETLQLISARTPGRPSVSGLVRHAIDEFVLAVLKKDPELAAELQNARERSERVVPLRPVKSDEANS